MSAPHPVAPLSRRFLPCVLVLAVLSALALLASPVLAQAQDLGQPAGRVYMEFGQGGFILSSTGGKGTLTFRGRSYPFKVGGLGVGGLGVSKVTAVGDVYRLGRLEDFPGGFFQARAGYAAVSGNGLLWLENSKGVVLRLRAKTKGLSLNLGADGLVIEMGTIKGAKPKG